MNSLDVVDIGLVEMLCLDKSFFCQHNEEMLFINVFAKPQNVIYVFMIYGFML